MKLKKFICPLLCVICCLLVFPTTVQAAESDVMPLYDYTRQASAALSINSNGKATLSISCTGIKGEASKINAETCLQRKVGLIWVKVDIGMTDNIWKDNSSTYYLNASHSTTVNKSDKYRTKTVFTVFNNSNKSEKVTIYSNEVEY